MNMKKHKKEKGSKFNLWSLIIWNLLIFILLSIFFFQQIQESMQKNWRFSSFEELLFLVFMGVFLFITALASIRNILKLRLFYTKEGEISEEKEIFAYDFFKMYQKLSTKRILAISIFPILSISILAVITFIAIHSSYFSDEFALEFMENVWSHIYLYLLVSFPCFFLFIKSLLAKIHNISMLRKVYDCASREEIFAINNIQEKTVCYVFTKEYLVNWDGFLNIIPLREIKTIEFKKYFYVLWYGTRLVLREKTGKKHTIWSYGPNGEEWIKRGFFIKENILDKVEQKIVYK